MRGADGQFAYAPDAGGGDARAAAGRSPLCALALDRALRATGREGDLPGVRRALALFVAHQQDLRAEVGKDLCHTGPLAQASYYFLYDHLHAAEAVQALPEAERAPLRAAIRTALLSTATARSRTCRASGARTARPWPWPRSRRCAEAERPRVTARANSRTERLRVSRSRPTTCDRRRGTWGT